ncbi:MAG TPA: response regulator transcription factor [Pseudonocardiaceae bacterium]|nr:response regulator transcription factor [Pseudonocardiaceae bacterium]
MSEIRTILADAAELVRSTVAQLLALEPDIAVVGEYGDGPAALAAVYELRPDVALLDAGLPGMNGVAVAEQIADSGTRVLIQSSITTSGTFHLAARTGVNGYVARTASPHRIADAVRTVAAGSRFVDMDLADDGGRPSAPLTPRERIVLTASARCGSVREICETVGISPEAVGLLMNTVLAKTGGQNHLQAAEIASTRGWI